MLPRHGFGRTTEAQNSSPSVGRTVGRIGQMHALIGLRRSCRLSKSFTNKSSAASDGERQVRMGVVAALRMGATVSAA